MLYGEAMPGSGFIIHDGVKIMNNEKTRSIIHQPRFNGIFEDGGLFERKIKLTNSFHINNAPVLLKESLDNNIGGSFVTKLEKEIVSYIESKTARLDASIEKAEHQIELLQELKQSIITEVVTGKRKVV